MLIIFYIKINMFICTNKQSSLEIWSEWQSIIQLSPVLTAQLSAFIIVRMIVNAFSLVKMKSVKICKTQLTNEIEEKASIQFFFNLIGQLNSWTQKKVEKFSILCFLPARIKTPNEKPGPGF